MNDPNEYTITCRRTRADDEVVFEARVIELPDVIGYGETRAEAEAEALEAIDGLQKMAKEMGHEFPAPSPVPAEYSGRITLRTSKTLHRQAAMLAHIEDVSLNQFLNEAIFARVAERNRANDRTAITMDTCTLSAGGSTAGAVKAYTGWVGGVRAAYGRYMAAYITHVGRGQTAHFSDKVVEAPFMASNLYEADL